MIRETMSPQEAVIELAVDNALVLHYGLIPNCGKVLQVDCCALSSTLDWPSFYKV
jgi:hypothetical protein